MRAQGPDARLSSFQGKGIGGDLRRATATRFPCTTPRSTGHFFRSPPLMPARRVRGHRSRFDRVESEPPPRTTAVPR